MIISADMKFSDAAVSWLDMRDAGTSRARYLKPRTIKTYRHELEAQAAIASRMAFDSPVRVPSGGSPVTSS
jgi:hypothetical protein